MDKTLMKPGGAGDITVTNTGLPVASFAAMLLFIMPVNPRISQRGRERRLLHKNMFSLLRT